MDDLISRQAAIGRKVLLEDWTGKEHYAVLVTDIEQLPPVQFEIVRCKDCKHHWTHWCMDSMPIERCDLGQTFYDADVDFCSLAEKREVTT